MANDLPITLDGLGNGLITGLQGSGKSHFVITQILRDILATTDKDVYLVNVKGVDIINDKLHIEDDTFNWVTDAVQNSIIIYDESGKIERFSNANKRINSDPQVLELTELRHHGKQVFFIAQDPLILHPSLRKFLVRHIHFSNPYNDPDKTKGYVFPKVITNFDPVNQSWRKASIQEFTHYLDPAIFPLYKSVDDGADHVKKKQKNEKANTLYKRAAIFLFIAVFLGFICVLLGLRFYNSVKGDDVETVEQLPPMPVNQVENVQDLEVIEETAAQLESKRLEELRASLLPPDYKLMVENDDIAVAMAIEFNGKCKAYNSSGYPLNMSYDECMYYLSESGRIIKRNTPTSAGVSLASTPATVAKPLANVF